MSLYRETKWLRFIVAEKKMRTYVIGVFNKSEQELGCIKWYPPWRQYAFHASDMATGLVLNNTCMQDILDIVNELNDKHKKMQKRRRALKKK